MAVSKLWPVTVRLATVLDYASNPEKTSKAKSKYNNADYQALRDVVNYVKNGEKTEQELFCEGINCTPAIAREQFVTVKEQFDKTDGIQAYHGYLSFKETDITGACPTYRNGVRKFRLGQEISGAGDDPSEYGASALPLCHQLCFLCRWEALPGYLVV